MFRIEQPAGGKLTENILEYTEHLGYSRLFRDFVYHPDRLTDIFKPIPIQKRAAIIAKQARHRDAVVKILMRQNQKWQAPPSVMENIEKLRDKRSVAVVAGQQACLFGGPYLVILKALTAVKWASKLEEDLSVPVVPIFWIAAEDHDFHEVSFVDVFDMAGEVVRLAVDGDSEETHPPVGALNYGDSIDREVRQLKAIFPENDYKREALEKLDDIYRPGKNIADCFAEYLLSLIGRFGIALFNPYDREVKTCTAPILQDIARHHAKIKNVLNETESTLQKDDYHIQVKKSNTAAHLFYHSPDRVPIHYDGRNFTAGKSAFSGEELTEAINTRPLDFSPDALTRPMVQSYFLPTAAVICGPAEVAYYAQIMSLFELFGLAAPQIVARHSMTVVEKRFEKLLSQYNLTVPDIAGDIESVINDILQKSFPDGIDKQLSELSVSVNDELRNIKSDSEKFDPGLNNVIDRTGEKINYQLKELTRKIFAAHKRKNRVERERIYRLRNNLYPNRRLAERSIAMTYLISRYGEGLIDFIFQNIALDETGHRLLMLSEYHG
jgi:bacillithiol biosynthesis cysteine-adding enzyme BshC